MRQANLENQRVLKTIIWLTLQYEITHFDSVKTEWAGKKRFEAEHKNDKVNVLITQPISDLTH